MEREHLSYCRICAAACGITVTVDGQQGDRVVRIRGDAAHPVSRGYTCSKGRGLAEWHHSPNRLDRPRVGGRDVAWERALDDLAAVLRTTIDAHGPDAVALADEIEAGNVRVLIVTGGNPIAAFPEPDRLRAALRSLDALVVVDVMGGELTDLATHVLPTTGQLERADISMYAHISVRGAMQSTGAVVAPAAERRPAWWVLGQLAPSALVERLSAHREPAPSLVLSPGRDMAWSNSVRYGADDERPRLLTHPDDAHHAGVSNGDAAALISEHGAVDVDPLTTTPRTSALPVRIEPRSRVA